MESNLQSNLHHYATDGKRRIGRRTRRWERPGTEQGQGFDDMVILRHISNGTPEEPHHRPRERVEKRRFGLVVTSTDTQDHPEQQRRRGQVVIRCPFGVEKGTKWMKQGKESAGYRSGMRSPGPLSRSTHL